MKFHYPLLSAIIIIVAFSACGTKSNAEYKLTASEERICKEIEFDPTLFGDIRSLSSAELVLFNSPFRTQRESDSSSIQIHGLMFDEDLDVAEEVVVTYRDAFKRKGYSLFILERNYGLIDPDRVAVLKTTDKFDVLRCVGTNGANYGVNNDSVVSIMQSFDEKYELELVGAGGDWCEFQITKDPGDWNAMAQEVYAVCKDVVNMGPGSADAYAAELKKTHRLSFFWD